MKGHRRETTALEHALHLLELAHCPPEGTTPEDIARMIDEAIATLKATMPAEPSDEVQNAIVLLQRAAKRDGSGTSLPDAFANGTADVPSNPLVTAGMTAIWKGGPRARHLQGGWEQSSNGQVAYLHKGNVGGQIIVYPNLTQSVSDALPTTEALWSFVEGLNPFTGDVALAVLAQMVEPTQGKSAQYPLLEPVRITTDAVLRYKGIQRWGADRRLQEERIAAEMERLRTLTFDVEQLPALHPATRRRQRGTWTGDRLFDVVRVERFQDTLFGESELLQVAWLVRAGQWASWWLNADGRVYLARMARVLLELDHQGTAMAKKLGQRILLLAGADTSVQKLSIGSLLEDIGEMPAEDKRDRKWAGRTRERFDLALEQLRDAGVLTDVSWRHGHDAERERGWVERWLSSFVSLRLADSPPPHSKMFAIHRSVRPRRAISDGQRINGADLVGARAMLGWKQDQLASTLRISRKHLSLLENGRAVPSAELAERVRLWLKSIERN